MSPACPRPRAFPTGTRLPTARRRPSSARWPPGRCRSRRRTSTSSPPAWSAPAARTARALSVSDPDPDQRRQQQRKCGRGRPRPRAAGAGYGHRRLGSGAGGLQRHRRDQADPRAGVDARRLPGLPIAGLRHDVHPHGHRGTSGAQRPARVRRGGPVLPTRATGGTDRGSRRRFTHDRGSGRSRWIWIRTTRWRGASPSSTRSRWDFGWCRSTSRPFWTRRKLLYAGPWLAERYAAFGDLLETGSPTLDPTVRDIVRAGAGSVRGRRVRRLRPAGRVAPQRPKPSGTTSTPCCCRSRRPTRRPLRSPPIRSASMPGWGRTPISSICSTCVRSRFPACRRTRAARSACNSSHRPLPTSRCSTSRPPGAARTSASWPAAGTGVHRAGRRAHERPAAECPRRRVAAGGCSAVPGPRPATGWSGCPGPGVPRPALLPDPDGTATLRRRGLGPAVAGHRRAGGRTRRSTAARSRPAR